MDNTLEYIFFHPSIAEKLSRYLEQRDVVCQTTEQDGVITISHADDLDDALLEDIENLYDELFDEESRTINTNDEPDGELERDVVGVGAELADGSLIQIRLAPDIARRVLSVLTTEELREMVNEIALQVENPIDGPLCKGENKRG